MKNRFLAVAMLVVGLGSLAEAQDEVFLTVRDLAPGPDGLVLVGDLGLSDIPASATQLPPDRTDPAAQELRRHLRMQTIVGFGGFLYDNRDRGHSTLPQAWFPALRHVRYGIDLTAQGLDRGIGRQPLFPEPTIGNASLAWTGAPQSRSLPRIAMLDATLARRMARLYASNHLYVFPEHRDHDAVDRFPAKWPYTVVSQGSSGSDRPFVEALAMTLAAFRTETYAALRERGLIAPTLQMLLRRNLKGIDSDAAYLSPRAHPSAFHAEDLDVVAMIRHAASLVPGDIVPPPRLRVEGESFSDSAGLAAQSERLFDTPHAIARAWHGLDGRRHMTVSIAHDDGDTVTRYHWRILNGSPGHVRLDTSGDGREAEITMTWHDLVNEAALAEESSGPPPSARIDIAVFADNGTTLSAPSFVSVALPAHQVRHYDAGPDGGLRLVSVDYSLNDANASAFDPYLFWTAPWTDVPIPAGESLAGWQRTFGDGSVATVPAEGVSYRRGGPSDTVLSVVEP